MSQVRDDALHSNYMTRGLPAPNHNLPLEILDDTAPAVVRDKLRYRWPLIMARRVATADEIEDGLDNYVPLFSDPLHGDPTAGQQDYPPTWMDPHILVILASQQPEIAELLEQAWKQNDVSLAKKLESKLQEVFERLYLAYVRHQFENHAKSLIAEWMLNEYAGRKINEVLAAMPVPKDSPNRPKQSRRRKRPS